jgi:hypothetical protein
MFAKIEPTKPMKNQIDLTNIYWESLSLHPIFEN